MAKSNAAVQFAGHFQAVVGELAGRLEKKGGSIVEVVSRLAQPKNEQVLDQIVETLVGLINIFRVKIGGRKNIAKVVKASACACDNSIVERCVLQTGCERLVTIETFTVEHFDNPEPSDTEIEAEHIKRGLKRPDVDHVIHFVEQYKHLPVEGRPIIFYLQNPVPDAGNRGVLFLWRSGAIRNLGWLWIDPGPRLTRPCSFAGVRE